MAALQNALPLQRVPMDIGRGRRFRSDFLAIGPNIRRLAASGPACRLQRHRSMGA